MLIRRRPPGVGFLIGIIVLLCGRVGVMNDRNGLQHPLFSGKAARLFALFVVSSLSLIREALAAGGGKPATKLINVADTRGMDAGLSMWIADVYNGNLWLFGLMVVVIMAGMGAVLGFGFDKLIGLLGIRLGKLDHHE